MDNPLVFFFFLVGCFAVGMFIVYPIFQWLFNLLGEDDEEE
jgi:DMSO reductase anchor subunit